MPSTFYNPFTLEGKTILITGASSGIGAETAIECSKMGAKLYLTGRNEERLKDTLSLLEGEGHHSIIAELTCEDDLEKIVHTVDRLDGIVLCAGIGETSPFLYSTKSKISSIFEVNFFAPVELLRLLAKKKKIEKGASAVFVSSVAGNYSFNMGNGVYGASKAAINSMMKFCAKELAIKKIRVNSVNPGMVNTQFIKDRGFSEEQYQADMEKYPLKRYGEPQDIAYGIIYLLSNASSWITGHSLVIDGGYTI